MVALVVLNGWFCEKSHARTLWGMWWSELARASGHVLLGLVCIMGKWVCHCVCVYVWCWSIMFTVMVMFITNLCASCLDEFWFSTNWEIRWVCFTTIVLCLKGIWDHWLKLGNDCEGFKRSILASPPYFYEYFGFNRSLVKFSTIFVLKTSFKCWNIHLIY